MPKPRTSILLTTLALCAWFIAQGVTALVGAALPVRAWVTSPRGAPIAERLVRDDAHILEGNLFAPAGEPPPLVAAVDDPTSACSGLRLVASVVGPVDLAGSVATVSGVSGKASILRLGEVIDDAEVMAVYPASVSMRGADGICQLTMFTPAARGEAVAAEHHAPLLPETALSRRRALQAYAEALGTADRLRRDLERRGQVTTARYDTSE